MSLSRISETIRRLDRWLIGAVLILVTFGLLNLGTTPAYSTLFLKQLAFTIAGILILIVTATFDYRFFRSSLKASFLVWAVGIALLLFVVLFGTSVRGATNWILIGPFSVDPIEIVKLGSLLVLAGYLAREHTGLVFFGRVLLSAFVVLIPMMLAFLQPDLGSVILLAGLWFWMVFLLRMPLRTVVLLIVLLAITSAFAWGSLLHDYQKARVVAFFIPEADPLGAAYQSRQAMVAVGAGGFLGRGFFAEDLSSRLSFLPESATDFAYASLVEQTGFLGALVMLLIFGLLLWRIERVARTATNNFSSVYAIGLLALFATEILFNIGMNLGLLPVTGLPLPFVSYGGSHTLVSFAALGILESIRLHQPQFRTYDHDSVSELVLERNV